MLEMALIIVWRSEALVREREFNILGNSDGGHGGSEDDGEELHFEGWLVGFGFGEKVVVG